MWFFTSLLKIISCNFIFTILEASIHFIGCLNGALRNANIQAWMNINKYAAHTWEVIFFSLTHVIVSTVWFHWKILALELWKMQLWSLFKQKTMSTLLMTITKSWIQILKCYALDCRRRDQILCQSAFNQLHNFPVSFPWHSYESGPLGRAMLAQLCKVNLCHRVLIFYIKLVQTFWSLQRSLQNMKHTS